MLVSILGQVEDSTARSALYYLGRYVKQAGYFQRYGKDIFDDEERSAPSDYIKRITLSLISAIEDREGVAASKLDNTAVIRILNEITALEDELGPEATGDEVQRAEEFLASIQMPHPKSKSH